MVNTESTKISVVISVKFKFFPIQTISAPFKIPKTQASCNLMALADSPLPTKTLADARDICAHHCSPYLTGRPAAPEASRTFGRSVSQLELQSLPLFFSSCLSVHVNLC